MRIYRQSEFDGLSEGFMPAADAPMRFVSAIIAGLGIAGSVIASRAAGNAATTQADASTQSGQLALQAQREALAEQRRQFDITQGNIAPWLRGGQLSLQQLLHLMGIRQPQNAAPGAPGTPGGQPTLPGGISPPGPILPGGGRDGGPDTLPQTHGAQPMAFNTGDNRYFQLYQPNSMPPGGPGVLFNQGGPMLNPDGTPASPDDSEGGGPPILPPAPADGAPTDGFDPNTFGILAQPYGEQFQYPDFFQPFNEQFQAPDPGNITNDPGFQFRMREGLRALENSAASRGQLYTSGLLRDSQNYVQGLASDEYNAAYGRASDAYGKRFQQHWANQAGRADAYNRALNEFRQRYDINQNDMANLWNRFAALAGYGQTAAGTLASSGQAGANNIGNILMSGAQMQGNALQNAGTARAGGYINSANAWNQGFLSLADLLGRR